MLGYKDWRYRRKEKIQGKEKRIIKHLNHAGDETFFFLEYRGTLEEYFSSTLSLKAAPPHAVCTLSSGRLALCEIKHQWPPSDIRALGLTGL